VKENLSAWSRALTLRERAHHIGARPDSRGTDSGDPDRARYHLACWRKQPPFDQGDWLGRRLRAEGLDARSFERLLTTPPERIASALEPPPRWLVEIREAYAGPAWESEAGLPLPASFANDRLAGFLRPIAPLMHRALARLRAGMRDLTAASGELPLDPSEAERQLFAAVPSRLLWMLERTLVLELNVARVEERLRGATPEERFASFVESLRHRGTAGTILEEYPVLVRQAAEMLEQWVESSLELLGRLRFDWPGIRSTFFTDRPPGRLVGIQAGAGDTHRGGRSVIILRFESGDGLVYKPRSLSVDVHFQQLLKWLDRRGDHPPFRVLKILDRGSHGWAEFVHARPCASPDDVARYHVRLGGLLAVLYAVGAVDFHFENLIADADQPVAVDLESLFHPRIPRRESESPDERLAGRLLGESVLRAGLLPFRVGQQEGFAGSDVSGVASVAGTLSPNRMLHWERTGSDEMTAAWKRIPLGSGKNRPVLEGREIDVADHIDDVVAGFRDVYRLLTAHRTELLDADGPIARFATDPVRVVLRSTRLYGMLLEAGFHPDFLRDALDRDRLFDRLWVGVEEHPAIERIARAEHADLWKGDVPYFGARPDSVDLVTGTGEAIPGFFPARSLDDVTRRIERMGEDDLFRQSWLTRVSLGTLLLNRPGGEWPGFRLEDPGVGLDQDELTRRLVRAARGIGEWFEKMAVREEGNATWVGLDFRNQVWSIYSAPEDLYSGTPGISLFLGYLASVTGDERFAETARAGIRTLRARLQRVSGNLPNIGMFQGWGGIVYTLTHLAALWRDAELVDAAEAMVEEIRARLENDRCLDVVAGSAGALSALLALHRAGGSRRALDLAILCGRRLVDTAAPNGSGLCWHTEIGGDEALTGFSHGAAGIALALVELAAVKGEERFLAVARGGFAFEREMVRQAPSRPKGRALPTPESRAADAVMGTSWCYGAPGRGLACLRAMRHIDDPMLREDLNQSLAATLENGFGKNHSLCHGDLGNLDFVLQADGGESFHRLARAILASVEREGWICGTMANIESPGLMNGLAGIGYGLLRAAHPARIPSVLVMDPPP
jgi:type 2 lantibiotic biosynthesis protein LanM